MNGYDYNNTPRITNMVAYLYWFGAGGHVASRTFTQKVKILRSVSWQTKNARPNSKQNYWGT